MKEYIGKGWQELLEYNQLADFDAIWDLKADWFEEPNVRRGGWSGVSRINLKKPDGESVGVFLKRQENHVTKTISSPIKGIPTFEREFNNIQRLTAHKVPTVEPIYFASRNKHGKGQAILITKELAGYEPLDAPAFARAGAIMTDKKQREKIMTAVADVMRRMHAGKYRHNCLYCKHIFIRSVGGDWEVKLIDLEKLSKSVSQRPAMMRDLYTLPRRVTGWRRVDRLKFLKLYLQEEKLSAKGKKIWREIDERMRVKDKLIKD